MSIMFASASVHACLSNGCLIVVYEANSRILMIYLLHFVHCPLNVLEYKHQHNPWSWRIMKNLSKMWQRKFVWLREFFLGFFNVFLLSLAFFVVSHSYDNWCLQCKVDRVIGLPSESNDGTCSCRNYCYCRGSHIHTCTPFYYRGYCHKWRIFYPRGNIWP